jgi:hypothetical protein
VALDFEVWVSALLVFKWIDVCHEVATNAVRVDELLDTSSLIDGRAAVNADVNTPVNGDIWDSKSSKDVFVEIPLTDKQLVHDLEEFT